MNRVLRIIGPCVLVPVAILMLASVAFAVTGYVSVPASALMPKDNSVQYYTNGGSMMASPGTMGYFETPVNLPHNAVITTVTLEAYDNGGGEMGGYVLTRLSRFRYNVYAIIAECNTGVVPAPGDTRIPAPGNGVVVNNAEYSYDLYVEIANGTSPDWGTERFYKVIIAYDIAATDVPEPAPLSVDLLEAVPNPSSDIFQVSYRVDADSKVTARVYDVNGRLVAELFRGPQKQGAYSLPWDGRDRNGTRAAPGAYVLAVTAGNETISRKVVLLK